MFERCFQPRPKGRLIKDRIDRALDLLATHSPVRHNYLKRDIQRIWITGIPSSAAYVHDHHMCVLDFDYVVATDTRAEEVALSLVHEGTHARLRRHGFGYDESVRGRIERICIRSEIAVARRFRDSVDLIAIKEARLLWKDEEWSDTTIRRDHREYVLALGWSGGAAYKVTTFLRRHLWGRSNEEL
jgi:hypothetical protein